MNRWHLVILFPPAWWLIFAGVMVWAIIYLWGCTTTQGHGHTDWQWWPPGYPPTAPIPK